MGRGSAHCRERLARAAVSEIGINEEKMRIDIGQTGMLMIERRGEYRYAICPFSKDGDYCGDWCPLFDVHEGEKVMKSGWRLAHRELRLCHQTHVVAMRGEE